jgi:hypothetical protein
MRVGGLKTLIPLLLLLGIVLASPLFMKGDDEPARDREGPGPMAPDPEPEPIPRPLPDAEPASLTGHVQGDRGPTGAGAWVMLSGLAEEFRVVLDDQGNFDIRDVPAGIAFDLWLGPDPSGARICRLIDGLVLQSGEHRFLELVAPVETSIRGRVVDQAGRPLENVRVAVLPHRADWRASVPVAATTGKDGRFFVGFENQSVPRLMRLVVDHVAGGFMLEERLVAPRSASTGETEVILKPGKVIAGRVLLPDGAPLVGAKVHLLEDYPGDIKVRRPSEGLVFTDGEGRFRDDAHRPGIYRIFVSGDSGGRRFGVVTDGIRAGQENVEIRFPGFGSMKICFEDRDTRAPVKVIQGDLELIYGHTGAEEHYDCWQSLEGESEFDFPALPEGHYRVRISADGYESLFSPLVFVKAGVDLGLIRYRLKPSR